MKNYKKILSLVLIIFAICSSSCTEDEIKDKICDKNFVYKGLNHSTLGNAELSISENEENIYIKQLEVAEEDGVAIAVPASQNLNLFFEPVSIPENAVKQVLAKGKDGTELSGFELETKNEEIYLNPYVGHGNVTKIVGLLDGQVQFIKIIEAETGKGNELPRWIKKAIKWVKEHLDLHFEISSDGFGVSLSFHGISNNGTPFGPYNATEVFLEEEELSYTIDEIKVINVTNEVFEEEYTANITGSNLNDLTIVHEELTVPNDETYSNSNDFPPRPWILDFGISSVLGNCYGMGFCNTTFPTFPIDDFDFPTFPIDDFETNLNQGIVTNGFLENDTLTIEIEDCHFDSEGWQEAIANGSYTNPQPFNLPTEYINDVFQKSELDAPENIVLPEGNYELVPQYDEGGNIYALSIVIVGVGIYVDEDVIIIVVVLIVFD